MKLTLIMLFSIFVLASCSHHKNHSKDHHKNHKHEAKSCCDKEKNCDESCKLEKKKKHSHTCKDKNCKIKRKHEHVCLDGKCAIDRG